MLLGHVFNRPDVNITLELFLHDIEGCLGNRLVSVVLFGSILYDDLAPGKDDLAFFTIVGAYKSK